MFWSLFSTFLTAHILSIPLTVLRSTSSDLGLRPATTFLVTVQNRHLAAATTTVTAKVSGECMLEVKRSQTRATSACDHPCCDFLLFPTPQSVQATRCQRGRDLLFEAEAQHKALPEHPHKEAGDPCQVTGRPAVLFLRGPEVVRSPARKNAWVRFDLTALFWPGGVGPACRHR